jgi:hypothetical protein
MASRRARKRERYLAAHSQEKRGDRQEMPTNPQVFKEIARGFRGRHARGDLRLIRHAIRKDWPLDDAKRAALMKHVSQLIRTPNITAPSNVRIFFAAAYCFIEADRANLRNALAALKHPRTPPAKP